jgi:hypothetical protein
MAITSSRPGPGDTGSNSALATNSVDSHEVRRAIIDASLRVSAKHVHATGADAKLKALPATSIIVPLRPVC